LRMAEGPFDLCLQVKRLTAALRNASVWSKPMRICHSISADLIG
jgi:hypothetical protein